jgi:hypothetical protein
MKNQQHAVPLNNPNDMTDLFHHPYMGASCVSLEQTVLKGKRLLFGEIKEY